MFKTIIKTIIASVALFPGVSLTWGVDGGQNGLYGGNGGTYAELYHAKGKGYKLQTIAIRAGEVIDGIGISDPQSLVAELKTTHLGLQTLQNVLEATVQGGAAYISKKPEVIVAALEKVGKTAVMTLHQTAYTVTGLFPNSTLSTKYVGGEGGSAWFGTMTDHEHLIGVHGTTKKFTKDFFNSNLHVVSSLQFQVHNDKTKKNYWLTLNSENGKESNVVGSQGGLQKFDLIANGQEEIIGFKTRSGCLLDAIGIVKGQRN